MSVPRVVAVVVLLVLGVLALPVLAFFLDGASTENWVIPVDLVLMAVAGALVWRLVPAPEAAGAHAPADGGTRTLLVGAAVGVAAAVVGLVLFFLLISGVDGA
ncbi:hypothetical protein [Oryzobacter terrae]|uniref:hypothetical protein n=1 Tax=Oryzobacter terrae TaxID=1620385 RepID=UPI00366C7F68